MIAPCDKISSSHTELLFLEMDMRKSNKKLKIFAIALFSTALMLAAVFGFLTVYAYKGINFEADERLFESASSFNSTVFFANGNDENGDYVPVAIETGGSIRKIFYSLDEISKYIKDGFVAVEDRKFYDHCGIDLKRTIFATANFVLKSDKVFGASTITQQVIKNISGDNEITVKRKLQEIIRAIHLERNYSKEEILEVYLNVIPMSENIYGIGGAARAYFGKEPSELLPEEAAMLIGVTNAPTAYNPYINPEACVKKRNIILSVMMDEGIIDKAEYERAVSTPLGVISRDDREDKVDSWFVERVIDELVKDFSDNFGLSSAAARMTLLSGGYKVYTTMNPDVQNILTNYFENTDNFPEEINNGLNYSMTVTDSESGYLVGMVGSVGKKSANRLLNLATTPYIPASTLKPIALYAPLIDEGKINWASVFDDVPVSFIQEGDEYREYPRNSPNVYDGLTTIKDAIRNSKNTVAVRLCEMRGAKRIFDSLRTDFEFDTLIEKEGGLTDIAIAPMALGQLGRGLSLLDMTEAFSVFSGEGRWREAISYLYLVDYNDRVVINKEQGNKRIFKETTARIMNQLLMNVTESGTAKAITLNERLNTAGKTGTSGGNKDKSFIGYTPYYTAGIWCGYTDDRSIGSLEKSHLKIWDEVMTDIHSEILRGREIREFSTEGLYYLPYCRDSGLMYTETCMYDPRGSRCEYGYFTDDNMPTEKCNKHILCKYDCVSKAIASEVCPDEVIINISLIKVNDRAFPKEIVVTDAEYVYRDVERYTERPTDRSLPYFQYTIPDGIFVGRSKREEQFNASCDRHLE